MPGLSDHRMQTYTFHKEERLCGVRLIQSLFSNGSSFVVYPFRVVYLFEDYVSGSFAQVLVSVSKRRFKKAVMRNRLKRLVREAYRLEKPGHLYPFLHQHNVHLYLAIQYIGQDELPLSDLRAKMVKVFDRLKNERDKMDLGNHH